jgi:CDP-diacylglycerol--glycerol-3-phosphate 3-phosphatidyltransferase
MKKHIPNLLTLSRLILTPGIIFLLYTDSRFSLLMCFALLILAVATDFFDGAIARKYNYITPLGTFLDTLVDKMLVLSLFLVLVDFDLLPMWMVLLLIFREFFVTGVRMTGSVEHRIIGSNWMGKSKHNAQVAILLFAMLFLYTVKGGHPIPHGESVIYYSSLIVTIVSLVFASIFFYWNRKVFFR